MAALDKIFELLDEEPDLVDKPGAIDLPRISGEIVLDDVTFSYGDGRRTRSTDLTLRVPPGQTVALVGTTGAGKSTLAKLVARFYDPTAGRVLIDGHDLRDVTAASLRSQMGIVPQEAFLFSGTIGENIAFGRPDASAEEVARGGAARSAPTSSSAGSSTATTRRSASAASSSRPGSASSSRSRARSSPTRASSCSTRRRRTSTSTPSPRSRPACGGCWPAARRS